MKKALLSTFAMFVACCGIANASIEISTVNVAQPANDTLLFALPVDVNTYQDIQPVLLITEPTVTDQKKYK